MRLTLQLRSVRGQVLTDLHGGRSFSRSSRCGTSIEGFSVTQPISQPVPPSTSTKLDYQQTTDLLRGLTDVRFKLLALVPTLSGAAVAFVGHPSSAIEILALGLLGLVATLGVLLFELRNSQLYDYALRRAQAIEAALDFQALAGSGPGGLFRERPTPSLRLFGVATVNRDSGLGLVYSAALAGWSYLVAWGALREAHVGNPQTFGAIVGLAAGLIVLAELVRIRKPSAPG